MRLRDYQQYDKERIGAAWDAGAKNVLYVLPTGGGKTVTLSDIVKDNVGPAAVVAHRQELVAQISLALARDGVEHSFIGPDNVVRLACAQHVAELGQRFYHPRAPVRVVGVDTLMLRAKDSSVTGWAGSATLWVTDEAHHIAGGNKWMKGTQLFPKARGLGVTATPLRADGRGLGRHNDGVFDEMIVGPSMAELIGRGYLTPYRLFGPLSDVDLSAVPISDATGDYSQKKMAEAVKKSHLVGDVVQHYLRLAAGKRGITFATDVETATEIADRYNAAGVPAAVVHAKTPDAQRIRLVSQLRSGQVLQLVNVDIFGEGFDLPAIEVCSMARPTQSYALFVQQFGRALRPMDGKSHAIIIDHVGNCERMAGRYGLPDNPPAWSLERRQKNGAIDPDELVKSCSRCSGVFRRFLAVCPYCGFKPEPIARSGPEYVDGDLIELDPAALSALRGNIAKVDATPQQYQAWLSERRVPGAYHAHKVKAHMAQQDAQAALRASIAWWAGYQRAEGRPDSESYRRFYLRYGVDVMSAQALGAAEALALADKINDYLSRQ